jgi:hypothetical protein
MDFDDDDGGLGLRKGVVTSVLDVVVDEGLVTSLPPKKSKS